MNFLHFRNFYIATFGVAVAVATTVNTIRTKVDEQNQKHLQ